MNQLTESLPYFFEALESNTVIWKVLDGLPLSEQDAGVFSAVNVCDNKWQFTGFALSPYDWFDYAMIMTTRFGTVVELITRNTEYFDETELYFKVKTKGGVNTTFNGKGWQDGAMCKRVPRITLYGKAVDCSVVKSAKYGCKIILTCF